jgi:hypothetical protein
MAAARVSACSAQSWARLPGRTRTCCSPSTWAAFWKQEWDWGEQGAGGGRGRRGGQAEVWVCGWGREGRTTAQQHRQAASLPRCITPQLMGIPAEVWGKTTPQQHSQAALLHIVWSNMLDTSPEHRPTWSEPYATSLSTASGGCPSSARALAANIATKTASLLVP